MSNLNVSLTVDLKNAQSTLNALKRKVSNGVSTASDVETKERLLNLGVVVSLFSDYLNAQEKNDPKKAVELLESLSLQ